MKITTSIKHIGSKVAVASTVAALGSSMLIPGAANALSANTSTSSTSPTSTSTSSKSTAASATDQAHLQNIIAKGDQEIERRLTSLSTLASKINAATKLTSSDKATLTSEVSDTTSGLTALKTQLDSETTVAAARTDAQNIYTEYRVYALVTPKVNLIKVADDQQVVEQKLQTLAQKLQTRLTAEQSKGKDVTSLQSTLTDMNNQIAAAQGISSAMESKVIGLQPTDYNSDHSLLSGDSAQLKTAHSDNQTAFQDAKQIVAGIKALG